LRGKRRYFRRVHRDAASFELHVDAYLDLWHYHADWPGWGTGSWRYRREHLKALCHVFQCIADARECFTTPFQAWILLDGQDAGQDATYVHTPSAKGTPFPVLLDLVRCDSCPLSAVVQPLLPTLTLEYFVAAPRDGDDGMPTKDPTHWIWARGIGEPIAH